MVVEIWSFGFAKVDRGRRLLNKRWTGVEREGG